MRAVEQQFGSGAWTGLHAVHEAGLRDPSSFPSSTSKRDALSRSDSTSAKSLHRIRGRGQSQTRHRLVCQPQWRAWHQPPKRRWRSSTLAPSRPAASTSPAVHHLPQTRGTHPSHRLPVGDPAHEHACSNNGPVKAVHNRGMLPTPKRGVRISLWANRPCRGCGIAG